jgi:hypothetical protein
MIPKSGLIGLKKVVELLLFCSNENSLMRTKAAEERRVQSVGAPVTAGRCLRPVGGLAETQQFWPSKTLENVIPHLSNRAMPLHKQLECGLLMLACKPMEELTVSCFAVTRQLANVP